MPVAMVSEFQVEPGDRTTANYDAVNSRLDIAADPPAGLIVHTAGFDGDTFRVFDVWESQAEGERFYAERLLPIVESVLAESGQGDGPPQRQYSYDLYDVAMP